jgi:hypothetical protein
VHQREAVREVQDAERLTGERVRGVAREQRVRRERVEAVLVRVLPAGVHLVVRGDVPIDVPESEVELEAVLHRARLGEDRHAAERRDAHLLGPAELDAVELVPIEDLPSSTTDPP